MDSVATSNKDGGSRAGNSQLTQIIRYKERNDNNGSNASSMHKGHGINKGALGPEQRILRPELDINWRQALALKDDCNDEDKEDDEEGGVSIIPAGMRPGWVWGPSEEEIAAGKVKTKKSKGDESDSQTSKESEIKPQRPFIPSNIVLGQPPVLTLDNARKAVIAGMKMNPNYRGALTSFHIENSSATALENCAVRVHGIHPDATAKEILNEVHTGKIYSMNRCPPEVGVIETAAADIVFITHAAAKAFIAEARTGIFVRGCPIQVRWNRNKVKEPRNVSSIESRIIRISGPEETLSISLLEDFFKKYFHFKLVDSKSWRSAPSRKTYELGFESIHPQAAWARRVFKQHFQGGNQAEFRIWFGPDPCDDSLDRGNRDRLARPWRRNSEIDNVTVPTRLKSCDRG